MPRAAGQLEDLVISPQLVHGQADRKLRALFHKRPDDLQLLLGKVDEAVDIYMVMGTYLAVPDLRGKDVQPVGRVGVSVGHHRVVGLQHKGHVGQLVAQCAAAAFAGRKQLLRAHPGRFQLVHSGEQHALQFRLAAGRAVDLQPGTDIVQRQRHAQHTPALVQHACRPAALPGHNTPGKAGKAEHLRIQGHGIPAAAAQLPLRFMAVLLGHNEHAAARALTHKAVYFRYDGGGFAGARLAGEKSQHSDPPKKIFFFVFYQIWLRVTSRSRKGFFIFSRHLNKRTKCDIK